MNGPTTFQFWGLFYRGGLHGFESSEEFAKKEKPYIYTGGCYKRKSVPAESQSDFLFGFYVYELPRKTLINIIFAKTDSKQRRDDNCVTAGEIKRKQPYPRDDF